MRVVALGDEHFAEKYRALSARDARFDGQFIAGVHSTGIYCRPSCPAMSPREANVRFYRTAAAAHEVGLRACKRCLPDAVPGSPDWNLSDDLAARAMRLVTDGVVEREGVDGLARRLGYTSRHVARVLRAELGAGPLALARAHRAQSARTMLASTDLPIVDVAFASGFSSIRQFNETIRAIYETTPRELRHLARRAQPAQQDDSTSATDVISLTLRLPYREPFDGIGLMRFFADHAISGLESGDETHFERRMRLPAGVADIRVALDDRAVCCSARLSDVSDVMPLVARVRRLFDLDADSAAIDTALAKDEHLAPLVAGLPGIRLPGSPDAEEALFRTLVGQQVSVAAARTILGRVTDELGSDGLFPTARQLAEGGRDVVRGPRRRVETVLRVAETIASGGLHLDLALPEPEFVAKLVALPGIGPWTARYVAMRVLGNPDVLLDGDLVIRQSADALGMPASPRALADYGRRWAPWRSYAGLHLWRARPPTVRRRTPPAAPPTDDR